MKYQTIPGTDIKIPKVVMGCLRLFKLSEQQVRGLIDTAMEQGMNFFDHADVYGDHVGTYGGLRSETIFANAARMNDDVREKMILQSKCGNTKRETVYYDSSKAYILNAVDGILKRLRTDYLDILLLHRPDTLMQPAEIAEAFDELHCNGKVRYFGVSNYNSMQIEFLQQALNQKIVFNQMQFSAAHTPKVDSGLTVNNLIDQSIDRDGGTLEYCRMKNIALQAWSPFQKRFFEGIFLGDMEEYAPLNKKLNELAEKYGVTNTAIAIAWILTHPGIAQAIIGTTNTQRMIDCASGAEVSLTREEWYDVYRSAGNPIL